MIEPTSGKNYQKTGKKFAQNETWQYLCTPNE
jgi:hypothetical protein